ncbi:MAG: hypothetical protein LUD81_00335 [Clostridiales bacterium]|nr:hypothetical protein [Clostridiales bacterium]
MTELSIKLSKSKKLGTDCINNCKECDLSDSDFLPVYLGYFFVALSINDFYTLIVVFLIVFIFTHYTQAMYFNPIFLIFGYHFYKTTTQHGTKIFLIIKGRVIRNVADINFTNLKRLNDTTYIGKREGV